MGAPRESVGTTHLFKRTAIIRIVAECNVRGYGVDVGGNMVLAA